MESLKIQTETIEKATKQEPEDINTVSKTSKRGKPFYVSRDVTQNVQTKFCFNCGGPYPHSDICPAVGRSCNKCGNLGHFSRCYRTKTSVDPKQTTDRNRGRKGNYGQNFRNENSNHRPLNNMDQFESQHESSESEEDIHVFFL